MRKISLFVLLLVVGVVLLMVVGSVLTAPAPPAGQPSTAESSTSQGAPGTPAPAAASGPAPVFQPDLRPASFLDALFNLSRLDRVDPALSVIGAINMLAALVDLLLIGLFFRAIVRTLISAVGAVVGTMLVPVLLQAAWSLPNPWGGIAVCCILITYIGLLIWAWRAYRRNRGKVEITVRSKTVRIEPRCIFCKSFTDNIEQYTDTSSSSNEEQSSFYYAVVPYPAHLACHDRSLERDRVKFRALVGTLIGLGVLTAIQIILALNVPADSLSRDAGLLRVAQSVYDEYVAIPSLLWVSLFFMLFSACMTGLCFGFERTHDKIYAYVRKHSA
jgi:hypothetical protein